MSGESDDDVLAPAAFERARVLAPFAMLAVVGYSIAGELVGLPLLPTSLAVEAAIAAALGLITIALWRRYVSERRGHLVLGLVWWLTASLTVAAVVVGRQGDDALLLILEVLGIALLLDTRFVIVSSIVLDAVYLPFLAISELPGWRAYFAGVLAAQLMAFAFHRVFRSAMLAAEQRRRAQEATKQALQAKLREIERSRAEREALAGQLAATERIEATGTLAATFAHQMNNILAGVMMTASLLARRAPTPSQRADYEVILAESQRGAELTRALLAFSRRAPVERSPQPFDDVVRAGCELIGRMLPRTVQLDLQLAAPVAVACDAVQIGQLLMNLATNAADAMAGRGTLTVATSVALVDGGRVVHLRVRDRGRGMDEATRRRVFDPFFTTERSAKGMGLPTAWGIVRGHDGTIDVESELGVGTTVTVQLPAVHGSAS